MRSQGQRRRARQTILWTLAMFAVTAAIFVMTVLVNLRGVKAPWQF